MMAKMFYTLDETKAALGRDDDAIKRLTSEGRLREFRDGPKLMYKADQVETLKNELANGGDEIPLGPSDTGAPIGLVDSRTGSGGAISLADSNTGSAAAMKEDTALAADLGLSNSIGLSQSIGMSNTQGGLAGAGGSLSGASASGIPLAGSMAGGSLAGSMGGIPSPARPTGGSGLSGLSGSAHGSKGGIDILDDNEGSDPSAQTAMSNDLGAEAMGSGSGLLDLTRESDNTSLGAVLDEIPGGSMAGGSLAGSLAGGSLAGGSLAGSFAGGTLSGGLPGGTRTAETMGATVSSSGPGMPIVGSGRVITPPTYVEARDALAPAFGGASLGAAAFGLLAAFVLANGVMNTHASLLEPIQKYELPVIAGIGAGLAVIGFVIGLVIGKARA
ncbi:MAG: hypothetical protein QM754_10125 [Tepidisphaeraceae bacterium]